MSNDSTRKSKRTPATDPALTPVTPASAEAAALQDGELIPAQGCAPERNKGVIQAVSESSELRFVPKNMPNVAQARNLARYVIYREGEMEYIIANGKRLYLDSFIAKEIGLSRPRDLRRTIARSIERGDIARDQYIEMTDDEVTRYYVDSEASVFLAFNSTSGDKRLMVMRVVGRIRSIEEVDKASISQKDALVGYERTINFMAKKDAPRAAKMAKVPLLDLYCRVASLPMPDISDLIGPDQPRLDGV